MKQKDWKDGLIQLAKVLGVVAAGSLLAFAAASLIVYEYERLL